MPFNWISIVAQVYPATSSLTKHLRFVF